MPVGQPEFIDNPEPRCPVVLLLDRSGSMAGQPIEELNRGLMIFKESVEEDALASLRVEIAIVSFGPVELAQDFVTIDGFVPPRLTADGGTPVGEAIDFTLDLLETRKRIYKADGVPYHQPWVWLITDGAPTSPWRNAAEQINRAEANRQLSFFTVAVEGADMAILRQIAPPQRPPLLLNGLDFKSMFLWLSQSMKRVSTGKPGDGMTVLPAVGWGSAPN
ncbi:VWA domain-containing protein [Trichocoleus desertorum AS-A10]|uniref:vWA domain-containing protein n=1 Tax=Trichocoleus desertorum TaxID=1481672 RepID=UPI003298EAAB